MAYYCDDIIKQVGEEYFSYAVNVREKLHQIPELSLSEEKTRDFIVSELKGLGYSPKVIKTGCFVTATGQNKSKTIALRCDIDALPITEQTDCAFASKNGCMHACGHDGHTAMLLAVAKMLKDNKPKCNVRLIFQPGEEGFGGATQMIDGGAIEGVDMIFAFHMCPELDEGKISSCAGAMFAGAVEFDVEFYGTESHVAMREKGVDALRSANEYISALYEIEKKYSPHVLLHAGKISSGTARNVVSNYAKVECTFRFFDYERKEAVMMDVASMLVKIDNKLNTQHRLTVNAVYDPVINGGIALAELKRVVDVIECEPRFTAEDFSAYLLKTEGCMAWLGCKTEKYSYPLHSSRFGFENTALAYGLGAYKKLIY